MASVHAQPAAAQYADGPSATLEIVTDERRRGVSWSDGKAALRGDVAVPLAQGLNLKGSATSLAGSTRHGGADAVIDIGADYGRQFGSWRLTAEGRYHLFPGASGQDYGEFGATAGFLIGPASLDMGALYAPQQSSIGGDNLYLKTAAALALPGTPITLSAHVGRSSGVVKDVEKAARLRPGGRYWDHGVAIDWYRANWFAGIRYTGADGAAGRHAGSRLIARFGLSL